MSVSTTSFANQIYTAASKKHDDKKRKSTPVVADAVPGWCCFIVIRYLLIVFAEDTTIISKESWLDTYKNIILTNLEPEIYFS